MTKFHPRRTDFRDPPRGKSRPHGLDTSKEDCPKDRERFCSVGESYDDSFSHFYRDGNRSRHMKRRRDNESSLSSVSKSDSSDGRYRRSRSKRHKSTDEDDLMRPWMCEEEDPFTPRICDSTGGKIGNSYMVSHAYINSTRGSQGSSGDPKIKQKDGETIEDFMERFKVETGRMKGASECMRIFGFIGDPKIKQKDGETIEDFMERFKVETGRMKGASECMRIFGFMYRVNNPELTKGLNENVPKTMEKMMITTTAFIRREGAGASKKKGHASWKAQDQSKRKNSDKRSHFRGHSREGRGSNRFTPLQGRRKRFLWPKRQRITRQKVTQSFERVKEITFPPLAASSGTEGPLVIEAEMGEHMIHRMYVDGGSSMEILYEHCFNRLRPEIKSQMVRATTSLTAFSGETIWPLGQLRPLVIIGDANHSTRAWMNFMFVRSLSPYNGIIGRPRLRAIQAMPSTVHGMLKFPVEGGIVTIRSTVLIPTECTSVITSSAISKEERTRPANFKVALHPDFPNQEVAIGGTLSDKGRTKLCSILKKNLDIFAWQPSDMTGVPRSIVEHRLNIREWYSPVRQKKRGQAPERDKAIQAEVQKLVKAGIMREVYYHDWLSNLVMVKKHDGSWRMCLDFTDLNKACPHDCYPLPEIDWKVVSLCGYPFKCFLDAYKSYHQIQLAEPDEEKTAFHTRQGVYCYTKMPFGLKNAGATYQRLMDKAFESQIGRNIEVYVDDLVVRSYTEAEMMRDIEETFYTLHKVNMKLNPKKYSFGLAEGMFLGYVVIPEGIKSCPDKTAAVLQLPSPWTIKEAVVPYAVVKMCWTAPGEGRAGHDTKMQRLSVSMDYFTNWIEAKAVATIMGGQKDRSLGEGIKSRLGEGNKNWVEEFLHVLWAHRTMIKSSHGDTPFSLTYGTEAVIPTEIGMPTYRIAAVDVVSNDEELRLNLDLLEERREGAAICEAKVK
nr:reverse transcriptase domain-containing protein [Tanacetum cinerariifolium]